MTMDLDEIVIPRKVSKVRQNDPVDFETTTSGFPFIGLYLNGKVKMMKPEEALARVRKYVGPGLPASTYKVLTAAGAYAYCQDPLGDGTDPSIEHLDMRDMYLAELKPKRMEEDSWASLIHRIANLDQPTIVRLVKKGLSDDQKEALDKLVNWLEESNTEDNRFFVLRGYAGSGKTTLCKRVLLYLSLVNPRMGHGFTAPTNKATKVLRSMVDKDAVTIYSALKLTMAEDEDKQKLTAADKSNITIPVGSLLGIDEASMLNTILVDRIQAVAEDRNLKVLIVGDPAQLRPVGETESQAWWLAKNDMHKAMLTEVQRFDNQILALSKRIRRALKDAQEERSVDCEKLFRDDNDGMTEGVFKLNSTADFVGRLEAIARKSGPSGFQNIRVLAWRNKAVDTYNDIIRKALGFDQNDYNIGETIMLAAPMITEINGKKNIVASIDDEFEIMSIEEKMGDHDYPELYDVFSSNPSLYLSPVRYYDIVSTTGMHIRVTPKEDSEVEENLNKLMKQAFKLSGSERKRAWSYYWKMRYFTTPVRPAAAMTVHRSQGSGYQTVFIDLQDILSNPDMEERLQLAYVGATRAINSIYYL